MLMPKVKPVEKLPKGPSVYVIGARVKSRTGMVYRVSPDGSLRRIVGGKIRGKAARKVAKRARRLAREKA